MQMWVGTDFLVPIQKPQTNGIGLTTIFQSVERNEELFFLDAGHTRHGQKYVSTISSRGSFLTPLHKELDKDYKNLDRRVVRLNIIPRPSFGYFTTVI